MYVSSHLKALGHEVKVLNYNLWGYDFKEEIKDCQFVLFTGFEDFKPMILRDSAICHEMGIETMVGGALATFGGIDEFEGYHHRGEIETGHIDAVPWPDYEGFGINEYHLRHNMKYMGVLTSRGCPYSCTFCAQTCKFRMRDIDKVFYEVDYYALKYGIEMIVFNDNTLNINKPRFMKICEKLKGRNIKWSAAIRVGPMDEEMVIAAKESNCHSLVVGVETLNQEKLKRVNKKISVEKIRRSIDLLNKHKIPYHGNILVGFEWETRQDIVNEILSIPDEYNLFPALVRPFIGTQNGRHRSITEQEEKAFDTAFAEYANMKGKTYDSAYKTR
jgi:radical SAM superfamily enzyme YgiQ (UPF0313 family)